METAKLSIIVPTLNNESLIADFFESLLSQDYPREKLEVLVMDGGSSDNTTKLALNYGASVYPNKEVLAEPGVNLGLEIAAGDLLMVMAVDNIFYQSDALTRIVRVFNDPNICAAFPKHDSMPMDSIYTKYYNRFTDPFNHFVYGDAANSRTFRRVYRLANHGDDYDVYDYNSSSKKPLIALTQGITLRSPYRRDALHALDDCSPVIDLIDHDKSIAYVFNVTLVHHTIRDFNHFVRKQRWATRNAMTGVQYGIQHRVARLSLGQRWRKTLWPLYALLFIPASIRSIIGLIRDRELLWLLHPWLCFVSASSSIFEVLSLRCKPHNSVSRQ